MNAQLTDDLKEKLLENKECPGCVDALEQHWDKETHEWRQHKKTGLHFVPKEREGMQ